MTTYSQPFTLGAQDTSGNEAVSSTIVASLIAVACERHPGYYRHLQWQRLLLSTQLLSVLVTLRSSKISPTLFSSSKI